MTSCIAVASTHARAAPAPRRARAPRPYVRDGDGLGWHLACARIRSGELQRAERPATLARARHISEAQRPTMVRRKDFLSHVFRPMAGDLALLFYFAARAPLQYGLLYAARLAACALLFRQLSFDTCPRV